MGIFRNKKYIQGMIDGAKPFREILEEVADGKNDLQELANILSQRQYKKLLKIYFSDHPVKIKIVQSDKKDIISDDLRKVLSQRKFDVSVSTYQNYQIYGRQNAQYVIFIGNSEKVEHTKEVYEDAYGCKILKHKDMFFIMQYEDKDINQKSFLKYYEKMIEPIEKNEKLKQALHQKGLIDEKSKTEKWLDKISEDLDTNLFVAGLELMGVLTSLPTCLGEVVFHTVTTELKKSKADKEIIAQAQKQILIIKAMEIMEKERYKSYKGRA